MKEFSFFLGYPIHCRIRRIRAEDQPRMNTNEPSAAKPQPE
jgi:hypothetical protein